MMDTSSSIEMAKLNLSIRYIYLVSSEVIVSEDIDRDVVNSNPHVCQYFNGTEMLRVFVSSDEVLESSEENDSPYLYRFTYGAGVRLIIDRDFDGDDDQENVLVEIKASFEVQYTSNVEIPEDATNHFSERNVRYHVWPYWREFVHSTCGRIGLSPAIEIPTFLVKAK